jgi:hypothetical protein
MQNLELKLTPKEIGSAASKKTGLLSVLLFFKIQTRCEEGR